MGRAKQPANELCEQKQYLNTTQIGIGEEKENGEREIAKTIRLR